MPVATRWPLVGRRDELDAFTAALHDPGCQALSIYGPSGVGKTRLGDECLKVAATTGRRVLRATPDRSESAVPLAAVAHLLPAGALTDWQDAGEAASVMRTRLLDAAVRALTPTGGESGRPVLLADDAQRFDCSSLSVVDHLLARGAVFCVASINSDEPVPETLIQWWRDERAVRMDLAELDPVGVDTLLHIVLEGPLDGPASAELWRASRGNLLILHELVLGAIATGSLEQRDDVWRVVGPIGATSRLRDLVERRIDGLEPVGRAILELLALCQPIPVGQLEESFGLDVLEALERDGLIVAHTEGRRQSVNLAHPIYGEVVRASIPVPRARTILLDQADTLERSGARRREDPVRIATMRLEATGQADPDLLVRGALLARADQDFATVARLAESSLAVRPTAIGGLLLGEALHNLGSFERAEAVLAGAIEQATGDDVVAITTMRRRNLFSGCRRDDEAIAVGRTLESGAISASARAELLAGEAEVLAYAGRPHEALALLQHVDISGPRLRLLSSVPRAAALAMTGRIADAMTVSRLALSSEVAFGGELATHTRGMHRVHELFALVQSGHLAEADERGRAWFAVALESRLPVETMWLAVHLARCALARGLPRTALGWAARASTAIDAHRFEGLRPITAAIRAASHGLLGDAAAGSAAADEAERSIAGFGSCAVELPLGRAWALVAAGDQRSARALLVAAAADAERSGFVPAAAWLFHDAARLGAAEIVTSRLAALAAQTDSNLTRLRAEHVAALVAGDGARLGVASERFAAAGATLLAAEAAAEGAAAWRRRQDENRAIGFDDRAANLAARCEAARTPVLVRARTVWALSSREREIAMLAAEGLPSRDIALRLSRSARTVDNHLGRIYAKLGVTSRAELAARLDPDHVRDGRT